MYSPCGPSKSLWSVNPFLARSTRRPLTTPLTFFERPLAVDAGTDIARSPYSLGCARFFDARLLAFGTVCTPWDQ